MAEQILPGDVIRTRKVHPCGGDEWTVLRSGADIRIRCNKCGRLVMMDRETFLKRRKALISRADGVPGDLLSPVSVKYFREN